MWCAVLGADSIEVLTSETWRAYPGEISKLFPMLVYSLSFLPNSFRICKPAGIWYEF